MTKSNLFDFFTRYAFLLTAFVFKTWEKDFSWTLTSSFLCWQFSFPFVRCFFRKTFSSQRQHKFLPNLKSFPFIDGVVLNSEGKTLIGNQNSFNHRIYLSELCFVVCYNLIQAAFINQLTIFRLGTPKWRLSGTFFSKNRKYLKNLWSGSTHI